MHGHMETMGSYRPAPVPCLDYSGTSMATPHVTGAAAFYKARYPTATADEIKAAILGSVTPTRSLRFKTSTGGRLNVDAMLDIVPPSAHGTREAEPGSAPPIGIQMAQADGHHATVQATV